MSNNKNTKIETERLLEEIEKLMSKAHRKPNSSLIDSKSSLSQKLSSSDNDASLVIIQEKPSIHKSNHKLKTTINQN